MRAARSRREFLGLAGAAGLIAATACSRAGTGRTGDGNPVTITHVFGETSLSAPPGRVVSAGLTEHDDLLAVGVVPVAVTAWFGVQPSGVWPWAQDRLGPAKPVVLSLDNGIDIDRIAGLQPDLIVAVNAGLDSETYRKLAAIAPTLAQSDGDAFFEPWKDQARAVGKAVFRADQMTAAIDAVDAAFTAVAHANPGFAGKTAVLLEGGLRGDTVTVAGAGWRTEFLSAMGFSAPDIPTAIPREELPAALDQADVLIWCTDSDAQRTALLADPAVAALRASATKRNVFTGPELAAAIAYASPLSYPVVAAQLPPMLARALG